MTGRYRVGVDQTHRVYFVRDLITGRCRGIYDSPTQALAAARRYERRGI